MPDASYMRRSDEVGFGGAETSNISLYVLIVSPNALNFHKEFACLHTLAIVLPTTSNALIRVAGVLDLWFQRCTNLGGCKHCSCFSTSATALDTWRGLEVRLGNACNILMLVVKDEAVTVQRFCWKVWDTLRPYISKQWKCPVL